MNQQDSHGRTALMLACEKGDIDAVENLLQIPVDVNIQDKQGITALMLNCNSRWGNNYDHLCFLLQVPGININLQDNKGRTALTLASIKKNSLFIKRLCQEPSLNCDAKDANGLNPAIYAFIEGNYEIFVRLIKKTREFKFFPLNLKNKKGQTPLIALCSTGQTYFLKVLLDRLGPDDLSRKDNKGRTALMHACCHDFFDIVTLLIKTNKVDPNQQNNKGWSPLIYACAKGFNKIVEFLLQIESIDVHAVDSRGWSPLMHACAGNHIKTIDILLKFMRNNLKN